MNELLLGLADELKGPGHWTREEAEAAERLIRRAVAENERLRDALRAILDVHFDVRVSPYALASDIAKAALEQ